MLPRNVLRSFTARGHLRSTTREFSCADQSTLHHIGVLGHAEPFIESVGGAKGSQGDSIRMDS